jgi:hypothetical protein
MNHFFPLPMSLSRSISLFLSFSLSLSLSLSLCYSLMVLDFELWVSWFLGRCFSIYFMILALCIGNGPFHSHSLMIHCSNLGPGGLFLGCADVSDNRYIRSRSGPYSSTNPWGPHAVAWPHSSYFIICKLHMRILLSPEDREDSMYFPCRLCCSGSSLWPCLAQSSCIWIFFPWISLLPVWLAYPL